MKIVGERGRNRTYNLLIKSQLLCQLSYAPTCCGRNAGRQKNIISARTQHSVAGRAALAKSKLDPFAEVPLILFRYNLRMRNPWSSSLVLFLLFVTAIPAR